MNTSMTAHTLSTIDGSTTSDDDDEEEAAEVASPAADPTPSSRAVLSHIPSDPLPPVTADPPAPPCAVAFDKGGGVLLPT